MKIRLIENGICKEIRLHNVIKEIEKTLKELNNLPYEFRKNNTIIITFCDDLIHNYVLTKIIFKKGFIHLPLSLSSRRDLDNYINEVKPIAVVNYSLNNDFWIRYYDDFNIIKSDNNKPYLCSSTSGTTGKSKVIIFGEDTKKLRANHMIETFRINNMDTILCSSPYTHSLGQRLIHVAMNAKANIVYMNKFKKKDFVNAFIFKNVSFAIPVTTHLEICIDELYRTKDHRIIISSSGSLSKNTRSQFIRKFGAIAYEMYGLSELGTCTLTSLANQKDKSYMGECVKGCNLEIIENNKEKIFYHSKKHKIGKIAAMTNWAFLGYVIDKKFINITKLLENNLLVTDDFGFLDNNVLHFISRENDNVKVSGYKVSTKDIQERLSKFDPELKIIVTSVDFEKIGNAICCAIFDNHDHKIRSNLREFAIANLESYMRPLIYKDYSSIPLLENGKTDIQTIKSDFSALLKNRD